MTTRRRVVVIGLDSITPVMVERFLASGHMPHLAALRARGFSAEMVPTMPPTTPAGWTTVATGAWPSTHGVEGFAVHREGDPLDRKIHSLTSDASRAEFLWQAAARAGRISVLLKFPLSWPTTGGDRLLQVDGAAGWGGMKCVWDLAASGCWDTHPRHNGAAAELGTGTVEWMTRDQDNLEDEQEGRLEVGEPRQWEGLPEKLTPRWETAVPIAGSGAPGAVVRLVAAGAAGEDVLLVSTRRRYQEAQVARPGDWTGWLQVSVTGPAGEQRRGHVRFKVTALDLEGRRLRLYQSQVHADEGYTHPPSLAAELQRVAGPFAEWTESYDRLQGWIDDDTQLEVYQQHLDWMTRAARHLLRSTDWDLFISQVHVLDMAYHLYWGAIDPAHPQYDAERADYYRGVLARAHTLVDGYVGAVHDELDDDTLVLVLGEHGHDSYHTNFLVNHLLLKEGLLGLRRDRRTGAARVDWSTTSAYASSYRVYLNLRGRDPQGTVPPERRAEVVDRIISLLYSVVDERTGQHPVRLAVAREDARGFGLYGSSIGDVVMAMAPGYQSRTTFHLPPTVLQGHVLRRDQVPLFRRTRLLRDFTGEHDTSLPWTRAIRTMLFAAGPGIPPARADVPVRILDVAATVCDFLGIPAPGANEGNSMLPRLTGSGGEAG